MSVQPSQYLTNLINECKKQYTDAVSGLKELSSAIQTDIKQLHDLRNKNRASHKAYKDKCASQITAYNALIESHYKKQDQIRNYNMDTIFNVSFTTDIVRRYNIHLYETNRNDSTYRSWYNNFYWVGDDQDVGQVGFNYLGSQGFPPVDLNPSWFFPMKKIPTKGYNDSFFTKYNRLTQFITNNLYTLGVIDYTQYAGTIVPYNYVVPSFSPDTYVTVPSYTTNTLKDMLLEKVNQLKEKKNYTNGLREYNKNYILSITKTNADNKNSTQLSTAKKAQYKSRMSNFYSYLNSFYIKDGTDGASQLWQNDCNTKLVSYITSNFPAESKGSYHILQDGIKIPITKDQLIERRKSYFNKYLPE